MKQTYPNVRVLARAYDRGHHYSLRCAGADYVISETYRSALALGTEALKNLGVHPFRVEQQKATFVETEAKSKEKLYQTWAESTDEDRFNTSYVELFMQLESTLGEAMKQERTDKHTKSERGWTPPPKRFNEEVEQDLVDKHES